MRSPDAERAHHLRMPRLGAEAYHPRHLTGGGDSQIDMSDPLSLRSDSRARDRHALNFEREDQMGPNTER